jgi:hypothetical protein
MGFIRDQIGLRRTAPQNDDARSDCRREAGHRDLVNPAAGLQVAPERICSRYRPSGTAVIEICRHRPDVGGDTANWTH